MLYVFPDYYKRFTCLADACDDTCCAGWQIVVDEKSLNKDNIKQKEMIGYLPSEINLYEDLTVKPSYGDTPYISSASKQGDKIILKKHQIACAFCGSTDTLSEFKGHKICQKCLDEIKCQG